MTQEKSNFNVASEKKMFTSKKELKFNLYASVGVVSIIIIGIWVLFSIPVIVYNTQRFEMVNWL